LSFSPDSPKSTCFAAESWPAQRLYEERYCARGDMRRWELRFTPARSFPQRTWTTLFVGFHGSWNRDEPSGYKVVRGRAAGVEDFRWGFLDLGSRTASGRPVDPVVGPDGALLCFRRYDRQHL